MESFCGTGSIAHLHPEKWVVTTTSGHSTHEIKDFAALPGWRVVGVADNSTAPSRRHHGVDYLIIGEKTALQYSITQRLPWGHIGWELQFELSK
jgi:hypothetical protein